MFGSCFLANDEKIQVFRQQDRSAPVGSARAVGTATNELVKKLKAHKSGVSTDNWALHNNGIPAVLTSMALSSCADTATFVALRTVAPASPQTLVNEVSGLGARVFSFPDRAHAALHRPSRSKTTPRQTWIRRTHTQRL